MTHADLFSAVFVDLGLLVLRPPYPCHALSSGQHEIAHPQMQHPTQDQADHTQQQAQPLNYALQSAPLHPPPFVPHHQAPDQAMEAKAAAAALARVDVEELATVAGVAVWLGGGQNGLLFLL
ncbi:hypothetical protein SLEP1_g40883 [Rubroshorea leprosula]|uniref:Uncharacterized protein n=1 Tax=Rubroshorea leprosula TaxID=152421 RepID=A0AAV5L4T2_9ROSI|nr:hypothetical protein SLEP1_g40883 [Rubroshorea leprosula]